MNTYRFPARDEHKLQHSKLIDELAVKVLSLKDGEIEIDDEFMCFLQDWILQHLNTEDMMLGLWIKRSRF